MAKDAPDESQLALETPELEDEGGLQDRRYRPDQEFFIPVYQFVRLSPAELAVLNHPALQRLGGVYQLGQTHLVFRGATHRRLEHCLGTVYVAQMMIDHINWNSAGWNLDADESWDYKLDRPINEAEAGFIRLAALTHDIGHLPCGHTFEDELGLLPKHDSSGRLALILEKPTWFDEKVDSLRSVIDEQYADLAETSELGQAATEILVRLIAGDLTDATEEDRTDPGEEGHETDFRIGVCRDIVGNTICADLLDYLHRDWHHLGKHKQFDQRLFHYLEVRRSESKRHRSGLVVSLGEGDRIRTDAVSAMLDLLESRYELFEIALYHRTKLCAGAMLERAVMELEHLREEESRTQEELQKSMVPELLEQTDEGMLDSLMQRAVNLRDSVSSKDKQLLRRVEAIVRALKRRHLHKAIYQPFGKNLAHVADRIRDLYAPVAGSGDDSWAAAQNRFYAMRHLEDDFGLKRLSLVMYCPPWDMSTKIAEVRIVVDGLPYTLDNYDHGPSAPDHGLTGGHLQAQKLRFARLWRVMFACEPIEWQALKDKKLDQLLLRTIKIFVLRQPSNGVPLNDELMGLLGELSAAEASPYHGKDARGREAILEETAARQGQLQFYPTEFPTLRHCFK